MFALSVVDYIHELQEAGFTQHQSEVQVRQLVRVATEVEKAVQKNIEKDIHSDSLVRIGDLDLAKKQVELSIQTVRSDLEISIQTVKRDLEMSIQTVRADLEISIEKMRYDTLKFTIWTGVAVVASLSGLMISLLGKGFHWF